MDGFDITKHFGCDVFGEDQMKLRLEEECCLAWKRCAENGEIPTAQVADKIANALKEWAAEKGATHYSHFFQPMTGMGAEKQEAFMVSTGTGKILPVFTGKELLYGSPDASSFPSGGLRTVAQAGGVTFWDAAAFPFIKGSCLYIPANFYSLTGEALDWKTPLKRSVDSVSQAAIKILRRLGDGQTKKVHVLVGAEQEYFLIPKEMYLLRPDLRLTGRTLFGAAPPKGQDTIWHYLSSIRPEVAEFMQDLEQRLWKLGIPVKSKHNEGAPCQHELAPIYSDAACAGDNDLLIMQTLKKCADDHGLVCLLHEKPFAGISGSGKHNNWSLRTDTGQELFRPGRSEMDNRRFLLFLAAFLAGVDEHPQLLLCSVASPGNDRRLGGYEAPGNSISVCLGAELEALIETIIQGKDPVLPISTGNPERNRTSPLSFTGNKFEFRMPGASRSIAQPIIALNAILADQLNKFSQVLEDASDPDAAAEQLIRDTFAAHKKILYSGNCYDPSWKAEARNRGLITLENTPAVLSHFKDHKNIAVFTALGIYSREEYLARSNILLDEYCSCIKTEAKTMLNMVMTQILPAVSAYGTELAKAAAAKIQLHTSPEAEMELAKKLTQGCNDLYHACSRLKKDMETVPQDKLAAAEYYEGTILEQMETLRQLSDPLEEALCKAFWPYPSYMDMLFYE